MVQQILHIDRCPLVLAGFRMLLESKAALYILHQSPGMLPLKRCFTACNPDLIITDLDSVGDGIFSQISDLVSCSNVKILVLTSSISPADIEQSLASGVKGYIHKNCATDYLWYAINQILAGHNCFSAEASNILSRKPDLNHLTSRELEVLQRVAKGKGNRMIADDLCISEWTVKSHMKNILSKLNANSRTDAVSKAVERGLVKFGNIQST
jgi:DNA-binding NarL/FixJ family response regulator